MRVILRPGVGDQFENVAEKAKSIAANKNVSVEFDFNGVKCIVDKNTHISSLHRDYSNSWAMGWKSVGPFCVEIYSPEVKAQLDAKIKEWAERRAIEIADYLAKQEAEESAFEERVKGIELDLSDAEGWNKSREVNSDGYGGAAMDYAEGWAKLMQIEIAKGKTVADCYEYTQQGVGFIGITGAQFGCAVSILAQTWKYGEDLRKAHNKSYGVADDVLGTVNPAILSIS